MQSRKHDSKIKAVTCDTSDSSLTASSICKTKKSSKKDNKKASKKVSKCNTKCLNAIQISQKCSDAIVSVHSEFIFVGEGVTEVTSDTPLGAGTRADFILEGNGFFFDKYGHIIAPAHLVLAPPSLTSVANRYPFVDGTAGALGVIQDEMVRASRIFVTVSGISNPNRCNKECKSKCEDCKFS